MKRSSIVLAAFLIGLIANFIPTNAFATLETAKLYKSVFGTDEKPKCITCHVDKLPKKEDGKHDLNAYGQKLTAINPKADEATLKQAGKNPDEVF